MYQISNLHCPYLQPKKIRKINATDIAKKITKNKRNFPLLFLEYKFDVVPAPSPSNCTFSLFSAYEKTK